MIIIANSILKEFIYILFVPLYQKGFLNKI